jgi:uridine phosphorylase
MEDNRLAESEFVLNADRSVYHLHLRAEHIADTVLLVGDQGRVAEISKHFDVIDHQSHNREFVTHTGTYRGKRITALSTGIGTDNIDIVITELDALVNMDLKTRQPKDALSALNLIRIGTCGALQEDIDIDTYLASEFGVGLDGLLGFYDFSNTEEEEAMLAPIVPIVSKLGVHPTIIKASDKLLNTVAKDVRWGVTLTNCGFYGPQGRTVRIAPKDKKYIDELSAITLTGNRKLTNMEMETSGIYGLAKLMGHHGLSLNAIIANRVRGVFSKDPHAATDKLIRFVLEKITEI